MSDIDRQPVMFTSPVEAADFELNFTLHHPITDEEWDAITDVGLDHTDNIFFHTKNGKEVEFVKRKKGKWIERESGTEDKENGFDTVIVCSCCDFPATTFYSEDCESRTQIRTDFCPNCGADMRGETDEQTKK